jgi:membrane-anchored glycerophosphoryl diester phosphodiesterase (GDPDase)
MIMAIGAFIYKIDGYTEKKRFGMAGAFGKARSVYGRLFLLWLIQMMTMVLVVLIPAWWFSTLLSDAPRRTFAMKFAFQLVGFGIAGFFVYAIPAIILNRKTLGRAIAESIKICFHNIFFSFFIIFLPGMVKLTLDILTTQMAPVIINQFNPDLIVWILYTEAIVGIFLNLFIYGAATQAFRQLAD